MFIGLQDEILRLKEMGLLSFYGYEFQGDSLLVARINLLMTYEEALYNRWKRVPTTKEYRAIINTIVWNLWQMDGLTGTIPNFKPEEQYHQPSLFEMAGSSGVTGTDGVALKTSNVKVTGAGTTGHKL